MSQAPTIVLGAEKDGRVNLFNRDGQVVATANYDPQQSRWYADKLNGLGCLSARDVAHQIAHITTSLNPDDFRTASDGLPPPEYGEQQYARALQMGREGYVVYISPSGCWSAAHDCRDGETFRRTHVQSYERLGSHSCTWQLVKGWVDGGAVIVDFREGK